MVTTDSTSPSKSSTSLPIRLTWGGVGALLLAWDVFEAVKHTGWVIPAAVAGAAVPALSHLAGLGQAHEPGQLPPKAVPLYNLFHRALPPFAIMVVLSFLGDSAEDVAAPFTFGMSWLTTVAIGRALGHGLRGPDGRPR